MRYDEIAMHVQEKQLLSTVSDQDLNHTELYSRWNQSSASAQTVKPGKHARTTVRAHEHTLYVEQAKGNTWSSSSKMTHLCCRNNTHVEIFRFDDKHAMMWVESWLRVVPVNWTSMSQGNHCKLWWYHHIMYMSDTVLNTVEVRLHCGCIVQCFEVHVLVSVHHVWW